MRLSRFFLWASLCAAPLGAQQLPAGFDPVWLDRSADPCTDFYRFACGIWIQKNPIPSDESRWGRFNALSERNQSILREILEAAASAANGQKIGDHYASCMDEAAIERLGAKPLQPELDRVATLKDKAGLAPLVARLHAAGVGAAFQFGAGPDFKNSKLNLAAVGQGGLSLPDRDYYLKDDPKSAEIRKQFVAHVGRMFQLLGDAPEPAARKARTVMDLETALARGSLDRVARRDPARVYHKMAVAELEKLAPSFAWRAYFAASATPAFDSLNVSVPEFVKTLEERIGAASLEDWKTYLSWHVLHSAADSLSSAFVKEDFAFFGQTLTGAKELRPRWKRCVARADDELGEALGQGYVERTFGAEGKQRMLALVHALERALAKDIQGLDWMTPATKKQALVKLQAIQNKIGYPDKWRDYSALKIVRGDALGNSMRAADFERRRRLKRIGQPVDPTEWGMTPPTVNAYYSPLQNNINFPAGILQPPFFDRQMDDPVNFGGIGAVIGHEMTHGFDDSGRKFAADGNLRDWWTAEDGKEFERRAQCFVDQYAQYEAAPGVKLNGKLTLGENAADNGGLRIAYMALLETLEGKPRPKIDGFTPEQRLFLGWGQIWCQNVTEESARLRAATDPHSPGQWRVNGVVVNMPEFQQAFGCRTGQPMVREKACRVW
ncbi:MAG: M13 family metallopeptidase [Acidobacteria bacterium]|nr:M13 family metallopeptidase [Acidobacteriota bacterium]